MKKRINLQLVGIASCAIILTLCLVTTVFYELFQKQVMEDLQTYTNLLKEMHFYIDGEASQLDLHDNDIRITVVRVDGKVVYDSRANVSDMENHKNREEIKSALDKGYGQDIRMSQTLDTNNLYYAERVNEKYIIRVSKQVNSILSMFKRSVPVLLLILCILIVTCSVIARFCTKSIIRPIENMAEHMDELSEIAVYKEMKPFVTAIQEQHQEILKSADMRQEFTANVSHELKTPLASISGYSELIINGMATDDDVIHFSKEIHRNAKRLLTLINDIIRLSQLDSSIFQVSYGTVDLLEVANNCRDMLALHAQKNQITMTVVGDSAVVLGDKSMLEEAIYNLCDNAIRYNKEGGMVKVSICNEEKYGRVIVEDNGIGISKENQNRIFERFYRVDKSRSKETGGTGLGLAIVKHIVRNHEAEIKVESELGCGTRIEIAFLKEDI